MDGSVHGLRLRRPGGVHHRQLLVQEAARPRGRQSQIPGERKDTEGKHTDAVVISKGSQLVGRDRIGEIYAYSTKV